MTILLLFIVKKKILTLNDALLSLKPYHKASLIHTGNMRKDSTGHGMVHGKENKGGMLQYCLGICFPVMELLGGEL